MHFLVDLGSMICRDMHDCVKNLFTIVKGGMNFSQIYFQNEEISRRNLSIGSQVELENSEKIRD